MSAATVLSRNPSEVTGRMVALQVSPGAFGRLARDERRLYGASKTTLYPVVPQGRVVERQEEIRLCLVKSLTTVGYSSYLARTSDSITSVCIMRIPVFRGLHNAWISSGLSAGQMPTPFCVLYSAKKGNYCKKPASSWITRFAWKKAARNLLRRDTPRFASVDVPPDARVATASRRRGRAGNL